MNREQSESKSEIETLLHNSGVIDEVIDVIIPNLFGNYHIIPKSDPPEKWVEIMPAEDTEYTFLNTKLKLKWRGDK
jgi:hypothetical protein